MTRRILKRLSGADADPNLSYIRSALAKHADLLNATGLSKHPGETVLTVTVEPDYDATWDESLHGPNDRDLMAFQTEVTATVTRKGNFIEEHAYLGGTWADDADDALKGLLGSNNYLDEMTQEALRALRLRLAKLETEVTDD